MSLIHLLVLDFSGLQLFLFPLNLGASHMVIREIALLAQAHGVEQSVSMATFSGIHLATEALVARSAHIFGIMLSVGVRTLGDRHAIIFCIWLRIRLRLRIRLWLRLWVWQSSDLYMAVIMGSLFGNNSLLLSSKMWFD